LSSGKSFGNPVLIGSLVCVATVISVSSVHIGPVSLIPVLLNIPVFIDILLILILILIAVPICIPISLSQLIVFSQIIL